MTVPPEGLEIGRDAPLFADIPGMAALVQVGRHHARCHYHDDGLLVLDLTSINGTFVDGCRISGPELVRPGESFRLGLDVFVEVDHVRFDPYGLPE